MSNLKKLSLSSVKRMSERRICEHLYEEFGIEANPDDFKKDELVQLFMDSQAAYFADLEIDGLVDEPEEPADEDLTRKVKINIAKEKDEPIYVDVSVNGRAFRIRRGVDVEVPLYVLHTLQNAVESFYEHDAETGENTTGDNPRFNISVKV